MYNPDAFRITDLPTLHAFIRKYSFATLITSTATEPFATHLPLLLDPDRGRYGTLIGHFARTNPHAHFDLTRSSLAIFHGPHAYVSPSWYKAGLPAVPTWNYATVHAVGSMVIMEEPKSVAAVLARTVQAYEGGRAEPWSNALPAELNEKLTAAVVAFEMRIERVEGKFKVGQNRKREDQLGVIEGLEAAGDADSLALAAFARAQLGI